VLLDRDTFLTWDLDRGLQFPSFSLFAHHNIFSTCQNVFSFPWAGDFAIVVGSKLDVAFTDPDSIYSSQNQFEIFSTTESLQKYVSLKAAIKILI